MSEPSTADTVEAGPAGMVTDRDPTDAPVMIHLDGVEKVYTPGAAPAVEKLTLDVTRVRSSCSSARPAAGSRRRCASSTA